MAHSCFEVDVCRGWVQDTNALLHLLTEHNTLHKPLDEFTAPDGAPALPGTQILA